MKKRYYIPLIVVALVVIAYFAGPQPEPLSLSVNMQKPPPRQELPSYLQKRESHHSLRPDNEARIMWYDSVPRATEYVVLYLHGFSASHREGYPVNANVAQFLGANLYLSRLRGHGLDTSHQLGTFTAEGVWQDAVNALARAEVLGEKVIIMSTSTGGTLALQLAASFPEKVHALINLSPNIAIADPAAKLLDGPWGLQIAKMVIGEKRYINQDENKAYRYWDSLYSVKALVELQRLLSATMKPATFSKISCPVLSLYYYRNAAHHDRVIDIEKIREAHATFATPDSMQVVKALAQPGNHVLASPVKSENVAVVEKAIRHFCKKQLKIEPTR